LLGSAWPGGDEPASATPQAGLRGNRVYGGRKEGAGGGGGWGAGAGGGGGGGGGSGSGRGRGEGGGGVVQGEWHWGQFPIISPYTATRSGAKFRLDPEHKGRSSWSKAILLAAARALGPL